MKKLKQILMIALAIIILAGSSSTVRAEELNRDKYRTQLNQYYSDLKELNKIDEDLKKKMDKIYESGMSYMENASFDSDSEIASYMATVEKNLDKLLSRQPSAMKEFLVLTNAAPVMEASYGQNTMVVLSIMNLGNVEIKNVVITPDVSNDKKEWPFEIIQPYDAKYLALMQASKSLEDAYEKRMDIGWDFKVREDVLTGCYPLTFTVTYYINGSLEETKLTTYINIKGKDPKKLLISDDQENEVKTNPRIIVTGYTTTPEVVYAGSTFGLTVDVQNTSKDTTVKNVLFDLKATVEGSNNEASYAAFLPTSGSSSVYVDSIAPGATYTMSIEMEAKSDLAQKPYVLTVSMKYDTEDQLDHSDSATVSVPIKQEAKLDLSAIDISPNNLFVGSQTDIMFSIYNTGKTTLYNVKVTYEGEGIDESGITYLGNIAPGATGNVDSTITAIAPNAGNEKLKILITYEDESGNPTQFEKEAELFIQEEYFDDGGYEEFEMPEDTTNNGLSKGIIVTIVIIVVIIVGVVVAVVVSKRKKAKKHKEDVELLEDDED